MSGWKAWVAILGGIVAIVGQWVPTGAANAWFLPVVGGALAVIAGIAIMMK